MRHRYLEPDYLAAFMLLGLVFIAGFVVGLVVAALLRAAL